MKLRINTTASKFLGTLVSLGVLAGCGSTGTEKGEELIELGGITQAVTTLHPVGAVADSDAVINDHKDNSAPPAAGTLPPSLDLSAKLPPVGDQGALGSCVGFAVGYATKTHEEVSEMGWSPNTPFHEFAPGYIWNQLNGGKNQGISIGAALQLAVDQGVDTLSSFPYDGQNFSTQPDAASRQRAGHFKAKSWSTLSVDAMTIKGALAKGAPVVVRFEVLPDFDLLDNGSNTVYDTDQGTRPSSNCYTAPCSRGGHAVALIGYDDAKQAFHLRNSWGSYFAQSGDAWLAYSFINNKNLGFAAYTLNDGPNSSINDFDASFSGTSEWTGVALRDNPQGAGFPDLTLADLLVGDFTGDGKQDLVATTGEGWYLSVSGSGPWIRTVSSGAQAKDLLVGDFDGSGTSDILYATSSVMKVSYGGNSSWVTLATSPIPKAQLLVGDFNGDGHDDLFRSTNGTWFTSSAATHSWQAVNSSGMDFSTLKVGEFDGLPGRDIFAADGNTWRYSSAATGSWVTLNTSSVTEVLIGNFDGTGTDDVFNSSGGVWRISKDARGSWTTINTSGFGTSQLMVANLDGGKSDLLK